MGNSKGKSATVPEWSEAISNLRDRLDLSQTSLGQRIHASAMTISRWERGAMEPTAGSYVELGNLAGAPVCWMFWGRAGLRKEDVIRSLSAGREFKTSKLKTAWAGSGKRKSKGPQMVTIPLLNLVAASHGEKGDRLSILDHRLAEDMIAAPADWCPNPSTTSCLRVKGNSMSPLICDSYILAVDSSQTDHSKLNGSIVIAWNKDMGLSVSRFQVFDHTEILQPENRLYESVVLSRKNRWKILAKVLWWIGKAP